MWVELAKNLIKAENRAKRSNFRNIFGVNSSVPVIEGDVEKPTICGKRGGWFTCGGTRILHPGAYSKSGWSNMVYICSSRRILVPIGTFESED